MADAVRDTYKAHLEREAQALLTADPDYDHLAGRLEDVEISLQQLLARASRRGVSPSIERLLKEAHTRVAIVTNAVVKTANEANGA